MSNKDDMSGTIHKEKEFRIVLSKLPSECDKIAPILIRQGILREVKDGDKTVAYARIREKDGQYSLGVKHLKLNQESETETSKQIFDAFYPDNLLKPQEKDRYQLKSGWIVDKKNDGEIVAEYEMKDDEKKPEIPEGWDMKKTAEQHNGVAHTTALLTGLNTVGGAAGGAAMGVLLGHGAKGPTWKKALIGAGIGAAESGIEGLIEGPIMYKMQKTAFLSEFEKISGPQRAEALKRAILSQAGKAGNTWLNTFAARPMTSMFFPAMMGLGNKIMSLAKNSLPVPKSKFSQSLYANVYKSLKSPVFQNKINPNLAMGGRMLTENMVS